MRVSAGGAQSNHSDIGNDYKVETLLISDYCAFLSGSFPIQPLERGAYLADIKTIGVCVLLCIASVIRSRDVHEIR